MLSSKCVPIVSWLLPSKMTPFHAQLMAQAHDGDDAGQILWVKCDFCQEWNMYIGVSAQYTWIAESFHKIKTMLIS